jgi:two-component system, NtrC family, response regulator AtoC
MPNNQSAKTKILVVDDDKKILYAFEQVLKRERYVCLTASSGPDALAALSAHHPAVIFLDIAMPHLNGMQTLEKIRQCDASVPVIMITGHGTMQTAIKAMQMGAFDYLTKPLDIAKVRDLTRRALASRENIAVDSERQTRFNADVVERYELIGNSPKMQEVYKAIGSLAMTPNQSSILITGESGTGKELVARAIHHCSNSVTEPFVAINCVALPENLLESELFGHEKGAFTGAFERKLGKFEVAGKGTIFLDEIGSLPSSLQQKLLRALQEREFERVGGNEKIIIQARFIAATNEDLDAAVKSQMFRKDLFFRLNVVSIHLPPLRERKEDLPLLANYFLRKYSERIKKPVKGFSSDTMALLVRLTYPGNVRQLENIVERAVIFTKGEVILPDALSDPLTPRVKEETGMPIVSPVFSKSRAHVLDEFEERFVRYTLSKNHGNVTDAAKESKMTRQNLQRLMKKHGIRSDQFR